MREIKFRLWDKNKKKMIFGPTDDNPQPGWILTMHAVSVAFEDPAPLMQFTGIRDKHGREIYENDILRSDEGDMAIVRWSVAPPCWQPFMESAFSWSGQSVEIIGNVWENGDLLKLPMFDDPLEA